jgi:hypothetical protein
MREIKNVVLSTLIGHSDCFVVFSPRKDNCNPSRLKFDFLLQISYNYKYNIKIE